MGNRITRPNCPCRSCTERFVGCHSICEDYADYKDKATRYNEVIKKRSLYYYMDHKKGSEY